MCVPLATHDDVVEAGGSEKTEEEAQAVTKEEEAGPAPEKGAEEAAAVGEAEEEAGPGSDNDKTSPARAGAEQEDESAPKVSSPFLM